MSVAELLTFDNVVFKSYVFWSAVLVLKMLLMGLLTGVQRYRKRAFANPEDLPSDRDKVKFDDSDVERVRRAHRNDLENILPFFASGFFYVLIDPPADTTVLLFSAFAIARIAHTLVYAIYIVRQPARAICYFIALTINIIMTFSVISYVI